MDSKDKLVYINELQFLQKQINFLETINHESCQKTIAILKTSQDKLYGALVKHGVTAEEMAKIITEDNDKKLVKNVIDLQKSKTSIESNLSNPIYHPKNTNL
ncbi:MAG: hypothetical protein LBI79_08435 [Nitrososphaerota archaeon]|nr:hypothetical protein [Nitrososphaerota archaeon]